MIGIGVAGAGHCLMRGLLTGDWFEHHGEIYDVPRIKQCPAPATPIPIRR